MPGRDYYNGSSAVGRARLVFPIVSSCSLSRAPCQLDSRDRIASRGDVYAETGLDTVEVALFARGLVRAWTRDPFDESALATRHA